MPAMNFMQLLQQLSAPAGAGGISQAALAHQMAPAVGGAGNMQQLLQVAREQLGSAPTMTPLPPSAAQQVSREALMGALAGQSEVLGPEGLKALKKIPGAKLADDAVKYMKSGGKNVKQLATKVDKNWFQKIGPPLMLAVMAYMATQSVTDILEMSKGPAGEEDLNKIAELSGQLEAMMAGGGQYENLVASQVSGQQNQADSAFNAALQTLTNMSTMTPDMAQSLQDAIPASGDVNFRL
jgi:hypothetical protein